jgi:hypothetical protein
MGSVGLCVDEWGAWYDDVSGNGTSFNWSTMRDAVIAGMSLNIFNNRCSKVKMALVAQPVNVIQSLMLTESGGQNRMRKTPVFWVFKLFKPHQGAKMVPATMNCGTNQGIAVLNASASIDANNVLHISIVNTHDATDQSLTINLNNPPKTYSTVTGQIVNGASITSGITSFNATDTASLQAFTDCSLSGTAITTKLPAHSVVMLTVSPSGLDAVALSAMRIVHESAIVSAAGGGIRVSYSVMRKTPIRLSLYGMDGRSIVESYSGNLKPGRTSLVWQPMSRAGTGVYVVKMESGEASKSQRVMLSR